MQQEITFPTSSPINISRLSGQNKSLYDFLNQGKTIHVFHPMKEILGIGFLNSRCSDLKKCGITVYKRMIKVPDRNGEPVSVKEYSLNPFDK